MPSHRPRLMLPTSLLVGVVAIGLGLAATTAQAAITHPFLKAFGPQGSNSQGPLGVFSDLQSIAAEQSSGDVYVYDAGFEGGSIYKFNSAGEPVDFSALGTDVIKGVGEVGKDEGELAVDNSGGIDSGDIYFASGESGAHNVLIYNAAGEPAGEISEEAGRPWGEPCGVAVDSSGNVYVGLYPENVNEYTPSTGTLTNADYVASLYGLSEICNIAADSQGDVYATMFSPASLSGAATKYAATQFNTDKTAAAGSEVTKDARGAVGVDPVSNEVYIVEHGEFEGDVLGVDVYGESGRLLGSFGETPEPGALSEESYGVSVDHENGDVYADNSDGVVEIFGTVDVLPTVTIAPATEIGPSSATLGGTINPNGLKVSYHFEYSTNGVDWTATPEASAGEGTAAVPVTQPLAALSGDTTYHVRLVATSGGESTTSNETTFTTLAPQPTTGQAGAISQNTATVEGTLTAPGDETTYDFEYGTSTAYGSKSPAQSVGLGTSPVHETAVLSGLQAGTTYHYRLAVTTPSAGTAYGQDEAFTTYSTASPENSLALSVGQGGAELTVPSSLPLLPTTKTTPPPPPKTTGPKPLTRAQKLTQALKGCKKDKSKSKRLACEKQARKQYAPIKKARPKAKH